MKLIDKEGIKLVEILYEDNHLLILNKPAGLLTQPSGTEQESLEEQAKRYIKSQYNKPGNIFLHVVHRLDKPVSGIVVLAKTSKALSRLNELLKNQQTQKVYLALVEGEIRQGATLEHYLFHDQYQSKVVSKNYPQAKFCRLHYEVLKYNSTQSLLKIILETGRYHQIRAQLAAINHPIIGDKRYGSSLLFSSSGIALHHFLFELIHPVTKKVLKIECPASFNL